MLEYIFYIYDLFQGSGERTQETDDKITLFVQKVLERAFIQLNTADLSSRRILSETEVCHILYTNCL
jgi:hypothetical protein